MPDISMCSGKGCPLKDKCYRAVAIPDEHWQSYFAMAPYDAEEEDCKYFWSSDGYTSRSVREVSVSCRECDV